MLLLRTQISMDVILILSADSSEDASSEVVERRLGHSWLNSALIGVLAGVGRIHFLLDPLNLTESLQPVG